MAYRFVRRIGYVEDKRNYILALQLLMKANPQHWRDLVAKQINLILAHEKYEPVKALAYGLQAMIEEKKK